MEPSCTPYAGGIVLDTYTRLNHIHEINYDDGYAVIEPGVTVAMLLKEVHGNDHHISLGSYPQGVSVLGSYTNKSNTTMRTSVIDEVLGLEIALPDGTVVRTGSAAFPNDVGWYSQYGPWPGLRELWLCANGSLGVITKAAVRIYPRNEAQACPIATFDNYADSHKYAIKLARSQMVEHTITYHWSWWKWFRYLAGGMKLPRDEAGLDNELSKISLSMTDIPKGMSYCYTTANMTGFQEVVDVKEKVCKRLAEECGGRGYTTDEFLDKDNPLANWWYRDYVEHKPFSPVDPREHFGKEKGMGRGSNSIPCSFICFVPASMVVEYEKAVLKKTMKELGCTTGYYSHLYDQGRSVFFRTSPSIPYWDEDARLKLRKVQVEMYEWANKHYKAIPKRIFYSELNGMFLPQMGGYFEVLKRIKRELDPNNIMNPGFMMFPGV